MVAKAQETRSWEARRERKRKRERKREEERR
jgi:hypothetical protein